MTPKEMVLMPSLMFTALSTVPPKVIEEAPGAGAEDGLFIHERWKGMRCLLLIVRRPYRRGPRGQFVLDSASRKE